MNISPSVSNFVSPSGNFVLVFYDTTIQAWLVGEALDNTEAIITNGYPHLMDAWKAGTLKVEVINVSDNETFRSDLYGVNATGSLGYVATVV